MKVIDLQLYRNRKAIRVLEERIGQLALAPSVGSVKELKVCFSAWLKVNSSK